MQTHDIIIIGAGAAGLMCALTAAQRGHRVVLIDHAKAVGEKIRISGGGRCNFTNIHCSPANFLSSNPHFCKSALARYTPADFIALVSKHSIAYHEKTLGQLFCDGSARQIIDMLLLECANGNVEIHLQTTVSSVEKVDEGFTVHTNHSTFNAPSLVIATGGRSIPKMGATGFGYDIAQQFDIPLIEPSPALVPFTMDESWLARYQPLAGVAVDDVIVTCNNTRFREAMLITHRGLSGPAMLQISSYWKTGEHITINLLPRLDLFEHLKSTRSNQPKQDIHTTLATLLPKRLAQTLLDETSITGRLADLSNAALDSIAQRVHHWQLTPLGTEGYRTAEVTLGGVDTSAISSKTFESKTVAGLYFIGEVLDVTGHLGGHNFQWAWASGYCCGQAA